MSIIPATDWISKWASIQPDQMALRDLDLREEISYAHLNQWGEHIAAYWLNKLQLKKGDRIAVLSGFSLEYFALFVAAQKSGLILVPLNYRLSTSELGVILIDSAPTLAYYSNEYKSLAEQCKHSIPIDWQDDSQLRSLKNAPSQVYVKPEIVESDPLFLLYTSGSTGIPKGVIYTHKMMLWNSINTALSLTLDSESRTVNCLPPYHTGGWHILTTPILHHGGCLSFVKKFDAAAYLQALVEEKSTLFMVVPTMIRMLTESELFERIEFNMLKYVIVGGESLSIDLIHAWNQKGVPVRQGYGLTEYGPNVTSLHHRDALTKVGSIGKPNFYVNYRCINEQGEDVQSGEAGELWLSGPVCTPGYWQNPQQTANVFHGEWLKTGDLVRQDADGYLYIIDRIKNMYISGGENIYPTEIENILIQHSDIRQAVVIGMPSGKWGEAGFAFIVTENHQPEIDAIKNFLKTRIAGFKIPANFHFMDEIPLNGSGKVDRRKLREIAIKLVGE